MKIEHIKTSDLETNTWSGGTTTQLAIYPKNADYKMQNFLFRISTASVECEESTFTKLPGISRKLMILDGEIKIEHKNHHSKIIKKFEQDKFLGDWNTKSYGKAIDFNLMTKENTTGEIEAITLNESIDINLKSSTDCYGFYLYSGKTKMIINNNVLNINNGDFVLIFPEKEESVLNLKTSLKSEIILSKIRFNN